MIKKKIETEDEEVDVLKSIKKIFLWCLGIACVVFLAIKTIQYDISVNGNCATAISGLWSAAATLGIGLIAYWQNQRYKKLADEANDLAFKPEIFIPDAILDQRKAMSGSMFNTIEAKIPDKECISMNRIFFQGIRLPIIQLSVLRVVIDDKHYGYNSKSLTITDNSPYFSIGFDIPEEFHKNKIKCMAELMYKNIYGNFYSKKVFFTVNPEDKNPHDVRVKRAERIPYLVDHPEF